MDEVHRATDSFERTADHLATAVAQIDPADPDPDAINIALAQAKRVRRESNVVVRALARLRDQLQP